MSDTSADQVLFASDPYAFMDANIVVSSNIGAEMVNLLQGDDCLCWVTVLHMTTAQAYKGTVPVKAFKLFFEKTDVAFVISGTRKPAGYVLAYYVPYANNETYGVLLGNRTKWVFTAPMDGCTFAIGSGKGTNVLSTIAVHSNLVEATSTTGTISPQVNRPIQSAAQLIEITNFITPTQLLDPMAYGSNPLGIPTGGAGKIIATSFGRYDDQDGVWKSYSLRYQQLPGSTYVHRGILRGSLPV